MEREKIVVDKNILKELIYKKKRDDYIVVENKITSSDPEDGGADHDLVIRRLSDNKFFFIYYTDWDLEYNFERDFPEELEEVFPVERTIIVYE